MRTVWYNLLAHPETLRRLREELLEADAKKPGGFTKPYPSWKDVCDLPYLNACTQEGVRLHPPFCLPFERVVPKGGLTIGGNYYAEGTVVGMSPYVVNRHKPTFGEDSEMWNPDRWMVPEERKRKLEASVMTVNSQPILSCFHLVDLYSLPFQLTGSALRSLVPGDVSV
jgi:cytochrome P450